MKKLVFILSLLANLVFIIAFGYFIHAKGGMSYLKSKLKSNNNETISSASQNPYWEHRKTQFELLPNSADEIIFLGNSITDGCEWAELFNNPSIKNRGISGDRTQGILDRMTEITESHPKKIFIMIGINDLSAKISTAKILENYQSIIDTIRQSTPETRIFIQSVLPTYQLPHIQNDSVAYLNSKLEILASKFKIDFIDLYSKFINEDGELNMNLSSDGLHLNGEGYLLWKREIEDFINEP